MPWQNPSTELQVLVHPVDHSIRIFGQEIEESELWRIYAFKIHVDFHVICISLWYRVCQILFFQAILSSSRVG